ncbi:hypothetical protein [Bacillus kwashiorkori]|uniref:hypothetical protein n=1 Tax=Bacillus kwashiorkori TaxID=1522318 RepID=UPI000783F919|nr:hypothetical protein [Bacillus kwashiorkori]
MKKLQCFTLSIILIGCFFFVPYGKLVLAKADSRIYHVEVNQSLFPPSQQYDDTSVLVMKSGKSSPLYQPSQIPSLHGFYTEKNDSSGKRADTPIVKSEKSKSAVKKNNEEEPSNPPKEEPGKPKPSEPGDPSNPSNPGQPSDPNPENPSNPEKPTNPEEPSEPDDPNPPIEEPGSGSGEGGSGSGEDKPTTPKPGETKPSPENPSNPKPSPKPEDPKNPQPNPTNPKPENPKSGNQGSNNEGTFGQGSPDGTGNQSSGSTEGQGDTNTTSDSEDMGFVVEEMHEDNLSSTIDGEDTQSLGDLDELGESERGENGEEMSKAGTYKTEISNVNSPTDDFRKKGIKTLIIILVTGGIGGVILWVRRGI